MSMSATYSPEDNKIRLYASTRLDAETYQRVKAAGFQWAPKQELFVAPKWTPAREDLAIELAGEIEPEEMTIAERAAMKAERLDDLANKKARAANAFQRRADSLSEAFSFGQPILVGHHSERKARKTADKMRSAQDQAIKAAKSANYWLYRAEGAEAHANMKNNPRVRAGRIKTLLAELRDIQRDINAGHRALTFWAKATTDEQIRFALGRVSHETTLSGYGTYSAVEKGEMTPQEARARCIKSAEARVNSENLQRWIAHILNRLSFEREMLGTVARYPGKLTPVILQAFAREHGAEKPVATSGDADFFTLESPVPLPLHIGEGKTLEMTADEWRDLMQSVGYEVPEKKTIIRRDKPADPPLVNLSPEQAEQLQRIWNARMSKACEGKRLPVKVGEIRPMTQAAYSAHSAGTYARFGTEEIDATGAIVRSGWRGGQFIKTSEPVARIRVAKAGECYKADSVVVVSDKPAKPLPVDLDVIERELNTEGVAV